MNKHLKNTLCLFLILTICLFSLSGCYNTKNIDRLAYVVAIGFDIGQNNRLKLSFQISIPSSSSGSGGSSQSDSSIIDTIECSSFDAGFNLLDSYLSKEANLEHCKIIVFSEEFAQNGISETLFTLINEVQVRPDCNVLVSRCSAEYFLNNSKPVLEKLSARYYEIAPSSSEYTGYTQAVTLSTFFSDFTDTTRQCFAILGGINTPDTHNTSDTNTIPEEKDSNNKANETLISGKANVENMGLAVFSGDTLVGELNGIETICHQIITSKLNTCVIYIPNPFEENKTICFQIRLIKNTKNRVELINNSPYINTFINLEARVLSMDENSKYLDTQNIQTLEKAINSYMTEKLYDYLYKISKEFNSDIDGFGKYAIHRFPTKQDWENFNWLENFKNSFFEVNVQTNVKSGYILMES